MQHSHGQRRFKKQGGRAEAALLAEFVRVVNAGRPRHDHEQRVPIDPLFTDERDPLGRVRLQCSTPSGSVLRVTLNHGLDQFDRDITSNDVARLELLVTCPGARAPIPAGGDGPWPHSQWLSSGEYELSVAFYQELLAGVRYEQVSFSSDATWPDWTFIEVPYIDKPGAQIVIALPLRDGAWGSARQSAFLFLVSGNNPRTQRTRLRVETKIHLCDRVRRHSVMKS